MTLGAGQASSFLRGEDVRGGDAAWPDLRRVPLDGYGPERTHPSVPES